MGVEALKTKARLALKDPIGTSLIVRARRNPSALQRRLAASCRDHGLRGRHLIVSFDCDTVEDIRVASGLHERMLALGVTPTYAVPGDLLRRGADTWRAIAATGAPFLNHGGVEHGLFQESEPRFLATLFYDDLTPDDVETDIRAGDTAVFDVLGQRPRGFRAPHFGSMASPSQQSLLRRICVQLGYEYSSSTLPLEAARSGAVYDVDNLLEFPVTAVPGRLLQPFDSWSFFAAPDRVRSAEDYAVEGRRLAELAQVAGDGILNCYADPAHVWDQPGFLSAVQSLAQVATPTTFEALVATVRGRSAP
jgi:peptidoglycan/xylan/chitin deacetylase (PgdA/CDA1 family)